MHVEAYFNTLMTFGRAYSEIELQVLDKSKLFPYFCFHYKLMSPRSIELIPGGTFSCTRNNPHRQKCAP